MTKSASGMRRGCIEFKGNFLSTVYFVLFDFFFLTPCISPKKNTENP